MPLPILSDLPATDSDAGFGALDTSRGCLPLKALDVHTRIDGLIARTVVRQTFVNAFAEPLEATYIFPLPDRAAVGRFRLKVADRIVEGELQEREKARRTYEQAIQAGHRAAIAEEERPNVFTMRVGNLPPNETATVELTLTGPLPTDAGEATFRFPLLVAPRYIPGTPLPGDSVGDGTQLDTDAVPDASRITPPVLLPGQPNPVRLNLSVEVHTGGLSAREFRSSLHTVQEEGDGDNLRFRLQPGERLDRDFILRFRFDETKIQTALQLQPDVDDPNAGTFALTVVPPADSPREQKPRDVVFVLDRSGSMDGWKMVAARRAVGRMIDSLTQGDRLSVLAFDDRIEPFPNDGTLLAATDRQRFRAVEFLAKVESRGGTELAAPLDRAVTLLTEQNGRDRILVLITDGQVGNEDQILRSLAGRLKGIRIFTLGIDQAVNDAFLSRLAGLGGGYTELVESEDRLDAVMDKVHRRIASPLLTGLKLEPTGLALESGTQVPDRLPDLFPGTPLTIMGRYRGNPSPGTAPKRGGESTQLSVNATDDAGRPWSATVAATRGEVLAPVWARGHLRELEDRFVTRRGDSTELEKRLIAVSLKFGVLCRFTAFVAVDVKEVVNAGGQVQRITQPVDAAAGWDMLRRAQQMGAMYFCRTLRASAPGYAVAFGIADESTECMLDESRGLSAEHEALGAYKRVPPTSSPRGKALWGGAGKPDRTPKSAEPAPDLSAYRTRAEEMLKRLEAATDRLRELGVLARKLEELLDDLTSIGVSDSERKPIADLLKELRAFLAQASQTDGDVNRMGTRCHDVLGAFAAGTAAPKRRTWFWK